MAQIPISDFGISIVTVHEQFLGSHTYISRTRNAQDLVKGYEFMTKLVRNIKIIPVVPFDDSASILFDTALPAVTRYTFLALSYLLSSFQELGCTS